MSIFDFFKKKAEAKSQIKEETNKELPTIQQGVATAKRIELDYKNSNSIRNCFIAFDVETTGLSPTSDRIIEFGAVLFRNGKVDKVFSSLINTGVPVSKSASAVNHITNSMLLSAPSEEEIYPKLLDFLGDALCGKIIMCAHNAKFDFDFLSNTLSRLGFNADIEYVDTLNLSRKYLQGLENYKQCTVEKYFGLVNSSSHRAASDAENCGHILLHLLDTIDEVLEEEKRQIEQTQPNIQELEVCAYIQKTIVNQGGDTKLLTYRKNSNGYISVSCFYNFLKFKFAKKGRYILIKSNCSATTNYTTEPCTQSEGGTDYIRVYFSSPFDLEALSKYIYTEFKACYKEMKQYASYGNYARKEIENSLHLMRTLTNEEISSLLNNAKSHDYAPLTISTTNGALISRNDVTINAIHNRVPLSEIQNSQNWVMGVSLGFSYWSDGEEARKAGNLTQAIELFDKARLNGYPASILYDSYALAYRQLKDYSNEIVILDEGIARIPEESGKWIARRDKAIKLLYTQQEKERKVIQKIEKSVQKEVTSSVPKQTRGRAILQMDDDGNIIKDFNTVSAAAQEVGVSSKCIRDAANGVQKKAGGYRWKYKD